jgi:hypothetical protein
MAWRFRRLLFREREGREDHYLLAKHHIIASAIDASHDEKDEEPRNDPNVQ